MWYAIGAFFGVFILIVSGGLLLFYREEMLQRISDVINPHPQEKSLLNSIQQTGLSIGGVVEHFENILPKSQAEVSVILQRLQRAGFRDESAVKVFNGSKVVVPILLCILVLVTGLGDYNPFLYILALAMGFLGPDFWLGRRIKKRQAKVRRGLPDVLDLLVICIEAGLSLDQATSRTSVELKLAQPELCDELSLVVLEQRAGRPRVHSDTLRTQRVQAVEEAAAKTTIKLTFPLVLFIFPSLFLVALGPAVISIMDSFKGLNH